MAKPVVILCGGFGTRMGNENTNLPKPMTEIVVNLFYGIY